VPDQCGRAIIFDRSAVSAYARGSVAAGELIATVTEDNDRIGVPVTCLAEAYASATGTARDLLALLTTALPAVVVLPLEVPDVPLVGELSRSSSIGVGHAVATAARANATSRRPIGHGWLGSASMRI